MNNDRRHIVDMAKKHHLFLKEGTLQFNESGLDFQVVFAKDEEGTDWVLRLPRRPDVMPRSRMEKKALDLVNRHAKGFQAPEWIVYTDELIAYRKLDGVPAGTIDHDIGNYVWEIDTDNVPASFTRSLGKVLAELHSIPAEAAAEAGLVVEDPEGTRMSMKQRMFEIKAKFGVCETLWNRWQAWVNEEELWPHKTGLIHGDVHAGHLMIDADANVTGLIDWTEAKVSDVSNDFVFQYMAFGEEGLTALIQAYKEAGGITWPRMKEHIMELAAAYPVAVAEFALVSGQEEYVEMAKTALGVHDSKEA